MKSAVVKPLLAGAALLALGVVGLTPRAASEPSPDSEPIALQTGLLGIAPNETLIVRALEAGTGTSHLEVVFLNERAEVVRRVSQFFGPGRPAKATMSHGDLGGDGSELGLPAVQVKMILRRPPREPGGDDASRSRVLLNMEFFNVNTLVAREGPTCAPPQRGGVDLYCPPGGIVGASALTSAR